jgi:glucose/arabinose dehydrogenase
MSLFRAVVATLLSLFLLQSAGAQQSSAGLTGEAAFGDWQGDGPGVRRLILPQDMPEPGASSSASNRAGVVGRPEGAVPSVPDGFKVELFAEGLDGPRTIEVAPNGDVFVAESGGGRISVFRPNADGDEGGEPIVFADGLDRPYGIAFYPPGPDPQYVYIAETDQIVRFPYESGDVEGRGAAETVVDDLPSGGHWTRDVAFSSDGVRMFVAVGSGSNVGNNLGAMSAEKIVAHEVESGLGAAWGREDGRAAVLVFDPDGEAGATFATGIRNCSGLTTQPQTGDIWCAVNERDGLGDNLPPDYVSRIGEGKFYGWPWYYIGDNEDPRHAGARPDLAGKVTVPDVLIQPHSAPLGMTFYDGDAFPEDYRGDAFVALHGSWNRGGRTGYKVVRLLIEDGAPTGEYEDFMTGFVVDGDQVWGRPVGVAVTRNGDLLVSEDGNGTIWRVTPDS